jgi:hypothetical protein
MLVRCQLPPLSTTKYSYLHLINQPQTGHLPHITTLFYFLSEVEWFFCQDKNESPLVKLFNFADDINRMNTETILKADISQDYVTLNQINLDRFV